MERKLILNRIQCLNCKDVIISHHRHDYVTCTCGNVSLDGGLSYRRLICNDDGCYTDLAVYSDAPFKEIRKYYHRGGHGKDGKQPLKWVPLNEMNDEWLRACIVYNNNNGNKNCFANTLYAKELKYRKANKITIVEE